MMKLLKKGIPFEWIDWCEDCFKSIKERLTTASLLVVPKVGELYVIYTDTSREGYRGVLIQTDNIITYTSRQLYKHEKNYTMHDLKLGAVVHALKI